jgi:hypothetical protein
MASSILPMALLHLMEVDPDLSQRVPSDVSLPRYEGLVLDIFFVLLSLYLPLSEQFKMALQDSMA